MEDRSICVSGGSGLYHFVVLCSYANYRTSYKRMDGISYTIYPGEWLCRLDEISDWFRTRFQWQALSILDELQQRHLITYSKLGRGRIIKFNIEGWKKHNTILDYNAPYQKDVGVFFFPISKVAELISTGKCSEMDLSLDMRMHAVYNDEQVHGSDLGPVVYMRNGTASPLIGYSDLAQRWGLSKATVGHILKKLSNQSYLSLLTFPGRHGSAIYLNNYLSTMFQISDALIDKEEVAMSLNIKISMADDAEAEPETTITEEQLCVSEKEFSVSKLHLRQIIGKVVKVLAACGLPCCECPKSKYKLYL